MSESESELPLVSIVTPTYNQAAFLPETIETVLAQDYPRIEHIVIDDGSTDNTREILSSYGDRFIWESHANRGQTPTINKGWQRSRGDIITWLNSDDTYLPGAVSKAVAYFQEHPDVDIVYGDTLLTEADGTPIERMIAPEFSYRALVANCHNPIPQPSAFIRRRVMEDIGLLDPHYYYFMDWDFWLRAGIRHSFAYFPELLSTYRLHEESKTVAQAVKAAPELEYMYRKFFATPDLPAEIRRLEKESMMNMFFTTGGYYLNGGDRKAARRMARKALQARPATVVLPGVAHKFLYCLFGGQPFYQNSKKAYHRVKTSLGKT
ncbi:MAG TPA: glycosyltransferase family 2 protein [Pyrinomonadaceae bacterium]|nr:glycosyltransferase family 2 protein [Pyrinomonadaceae bacterium]